MILICLLFLTIVGMNLRWYLFSLIMFLFVAVPIHCFAQTNIGILLGLDFADIKAVPNSVGFEFLENRYGSKSIVGGLRIEQKVSKSLFLSLQGAYTKKKVDGRDFGFVPFDWVEFKKIDVSFTVNWIPVPTLSIGGGLSHSFIPSVNKVLRGGIRDDITKGRREIGGIFQVRYHYKDFLLEANYYTGFKILSPSKESNILEPMNSIGISLSYVLRLFESQNGKGMNHQRI